MPFIERFANSMDKIIINLAAPRAHLSQMIVGYIELFGLNRIVFNEHYESTMGMHNLGATALVEIDGKRLVYDMNDGYNNIDIMHWYLDRCDLYFKRSFSAEKNERFFKEKLQKIKPLGLFYKLSCPGNPLDKYLTTREKLLDWFGIKSSAYFTKEKFEGEKPEFKESGLKILFYTKLWEPNLGDEALNEERRYINRMRTDIIRTLSKKYGHLFYGGLHDSSYAQKYAPNLILSKYSSEKSRYLRLMHSCDICIGSMGLHESIGGKTAEYVAAAKAIVNEKLHYYVGDDFKEGVNYIDYTDAEGCLEAVDSLVSSPEKVFAMKMANYDYYKVFLEPSSLIKNSLRYLYE